MAEINKVKVAGTIYDIQDKKSRDNSYLSEVYSWDGVADGMESMELGGLTYYRYSDPIQLEPGQVLAGSSDSLQEGFLSSNGENELFEIMMTLGLASSFLGCDLGPLGIINSGINITKEGMYKDMLFELLFKSAPAEIIEEFEALMNNGASVGFSMITQMMLYINTTKEITLSEDLMQYVFGEREQMVIPRGLWLLSTDLGSMLGWKTFPVHTDTIYLLSSQMSNIVYQSIEKLFYYLLTSMGNTNKYNIQCSYTEGVSQVYLYGYGSSSSNSETYFPQDRRVVVEVAPLSGYTLDSIIVTNITTNEQIEAQYYGTNLYTFYMPGSDVRINITMKQG